MPAALAPPQAAAPAPSLAPPQPPLQTVELRGALLGIRIVPPSKRDGPVNVAGLLEFSPRPNNKRPADESPSPPRKRAAPAELKERIAELEAMLARSDAENFALAMENAALKIALGSPPRGAREFCFALHWWEGPPAARVLRKSVAAVDSADRETAERAVSEFTVGRGSGVKCRYIGDGPANGLGRGIVERALTLQLHEAVYQA